MDRVINGYKLVKTCSACPEQYDVFFGEEQVGYLRLRHGSFTVECPECKLDADLVYKAEPNGDGYFDHDEREGYLKKAIEAIDKWVKGHKRKHEKESSGDNQVTSEGKKVMKIFLISQSDCGGYDTYDSAVVIAPNARIARRMNPSNGQDITEHGTSGSWTGNPKKVVVKCLGESKFKKQQVVCASFNAA